MTLTIERDGAVLRAVLDDPDTLNALSGARLAELTATIERAGSDPAVRVVLITGRGRGFSSGADLGPDNESGTTLAELNRLVPAIQASPVPVVAAVNGVAAGAGASLALACDLVIARRSAYFLLAFANIGLMPDGGASLLVPAAIGRARAMRMALLGERLSAPDALAQGLISHLTEDDEFDTSVAAITGKLAAGPPLAYAKIKNAVNAATLPDLAAGLERETRGQGELLDSADFAEGVAAFRDRRAPRFTGH